jgi:hypothetical protein
MRPGAIHNIIVGVIMIGFLALMAAMALDQCRAGDWQFIIWGGIVLLGVVGAIWEGGKRLLTRGGERAP